MLFYEGRYAFFLLNIEFINILKEYCFFLGNEAIVLVRMSFFGNNSIDQQCYIKDHECNTIARNANIELTSILDIFYDSNDEFTTDCLYLRNNEAAQALKSVFK